MGRPREHDEQTREALRAAAERLFDRDGPDGVSVRSLAAEVGTSTRAVYSLFGSVEALLVDALGTRAYELLVEWLDDHPETDDPVADLVDMAPAVFRRFVIEHPALYRITFQRVVRGHRPGPELLAARQQGITRLTEKVARLADAGLLGDQPLAQIVIDYQALCEGLANFELRGLVMPMMPPGEEDSTWRAAFAALLAGITGSRARAAAAAPPRRRDGRRSPRTR